MKKSKNKSKRASLKRKMNSGSILSFYLHRELKGDNSRLSEATGYSESHISNVKAGRRRIAACPVLANEMYYISRRRNKQEDVLLSYEY